MCEIQTEVDVDELETVPAQDPDNRRDTPDELEEGAVLLDTDRNELHRVSEFNHRHADTECHRPTRSSLIPLHHAEIVVGGLE